MNIVTSTFFGHFEYNINFLKTFNEKCLDKDNVSITFIVTSEEEKKILSNLIFKNGLNTLNVDIVILIDLINKIENKNITYEDLSFSQHKYAIINLKKIYGCLYVNKDCLVLDSEVLCLNEFNFFDMFKTLKNKYFSYTYFDDDFDNIIDSLQIEVIENCNQILKSNNKEWFFTKTYWFYEIEYLKNMINFVKKQNNIDSFSQFIADKLIFEYQLYGSYVYNNKLKEFKSHNEITKNKSKLRKAFMDYRNSLNSIPVGFEYVCISLNEDCIDEYIEFIDEQDEKMVKIHWMPDNIKNKIINSGKVFMGSLQH